MALANRAGDAAAAKLKTDAEARQAEITAQAERENNYQSAMAAAQSAYSRKDFSEAIKNADAALLNHAGDTNAIALKAKAVDGRDLAEVKASIARGDLVKARSLCAAHLGNPDFDELAKQVVVKASDKLDTDLEVYMVCFGLLDPKKAKTPEAKRETQLLGEFANEDKDQWQHKVDVLREAFNAAGRLDPDRVKKLGDLKKAVSQHL